MLSRRDIHKLALAAPFSRLFAKPKSIVAGVQLGVQSYSFRDRPLDAALKAMVDIGLSECELYQGHIEPKLGRDELRKWRLSVPMDEFHKTRKKFDAVGVLLYAYNISFRDDFTDEEIARGFEMAHALGVTRITASSTLSMVGRIEPHAVRAKIYVGMHNHSNVKDPNEFATPESLDKAIQGRSPYIAINLDIGHFTAANFDAVDFLAKHHSRIVTLHIKDRKKNQGDNVPLGEGDTPIKPVLQMLKKNKYPIPANIEYEYKGGDTVVEVRKCLDYCKQALA
jgi:sugar phosphate isomerase/epimerase